MEKTKIRSDEEYKIPEGVTVINVMADGSTCEDLSTYLGPEHPLPEVARRMLYNFICKGHQIRMAKENGGE